MNWNLILSIEDSNDAYEVDLISLERNSELGLLILHIATESDDFLESRIYSDRFRKTILQICRDKKFPLITLADVNFILSLSYLSHLSIHGKINSSGYWGAIKVKPDKCEWPGCNKSPTDRDHIWPNSLGGPYENWNLQWLCKFHNVMKSNSPVFAFNNSTDFQYNFIYWMKSKGYSF